MNLSLSLSLFALCVCRTGTLFAYGQTCSGKTYTMVGGGGNEDLGIIPRTCLYLFERMEEVRKPRHILTV